MAIPVHFTRWFVHGVRVSKARSIMASLLLAIAFGSVLTDTVYAASQYEGGRNPFGRYQGVGTLTQSNGKVYRGHWQDGRREGAGTQILSNGERYIGAWRNNKPHGNGVKEFANGDRYEGQWFVGKMSGYAVYSFANGDVYEGQFANGLFNGNGKLVRVSDDVYTGNWIDGVLAGVGSAKLANGDKYWGSFKNWLFHGIGEISFSNGEKYRGSFAKGKVHGRGVYHYRNGDIYKGRFVWGVRFGRGVLSDQRGNSYEGMWDDNKKQGPGEERLITGEHYVGQFIKGKRHGNGVLIDAEGASFEGRWVAGRLAGSGIATFKDGATFVGHFEAGLPHGVGECGDGSVLKRCEYYQGQRKARPAAAVLVINPIDDQGESDLGRARTPSFEQTVGALPRNTRLEQVSYSTFVSYQHDFSSNNDFFTQEGISLNYDKKRNKLEVIANADGYWLRLYVPNFRGAGVYQLLNKNAETGSVGSEYYQTSDDFPGVIRVTQTEDGVLEGRFEFFAYRQSDRNISQGQHIRKGRFLIDPAELDGLKHEVGVTHNVADVATPLL
ncbi:MAG: hypothetical protein COB04_06940 [Gammaproteobacteria bacterium]|nr:MAG: hypothetical protein COB04_06940 [Gammaproteobacteria bacterium]